MGGDLDIRDTQVAAYLAASSPLEIELAQGETNDDVGLEQ